MQHGVIDLNDDVLSVRRLRATAVLPKVLALAFGIVGLLLFAIDAGTWLQWVLLLGSATLLALLARSIEQGAVWAVWLLTVLVLAFTALTIVGVVLAVLDERREPPEEVFSGLAGVALTLVSCWLLISRALPAVSRRGTPSAKAVKDTRSAWRRLLRDERFRAALGTFTTAVVIHIGGAVVALLVGVGTGVTFLGALAYLPIARVAGRVWTRGRRELALRLQEVRRLDARSPVILLRSFEDDNLPLETRFRVLWFFSAAKEAFTLEEYVVNCVWRYGPVIAVGNPRETLSPLGAAREYVPEDRWRTAIQQYLDEAVLVVCVLGSTPGLRWEYEAIRMRKGTSAVVVVFPPRSAGELRERWDVFKGIFQPAATVDLYADPRLGVPVLALFSKTDGRAQVFYCRFNNETAYGVAFAKLFACLGEQARRDPQGEAAGIH
jgi:hypothetical protein